MQAVFFSETLKAAKTAPIFLKVKNFQPPQLLRDGQQLEARESFASKFNYSL